MEMIGEENEGNREALFGWGIDSQWPIFGGGAVDLVGIDKLGIVVPFARLPRQDGDVVAQVVGVAHLSPQFDIDLLFA